MNRSDRIYLSKFELDPDPDYLDLDDFDLDFVEYGDASYAEIIPGDEIKYARKTRRLNRPNNFKSRDI
jgi:hypothetical protein